MYVHATDCISYRPRTTTDHGMPQDECTDPKGPKDQGVFTAQKDGYLRGKFIRVKPEALLKNGPLVKGASLRACLPA